MTDWYYHDPVEGQVGPLGDEQLRSRYRERRIQLDTLVRHDGLREWTTLEKQAEALDLFSVQPDASRPPPVPPPRAGAVSTPATASPYGAARQAGASAPPRQGMSGCLIAVIVVAVAGVFIIGVLAAIALPAYNDYVKRAKAAQAKAAAQTGFDPARLAEADAKVRRLLTAAMAEHYPAAKQCPDSFEFESVQVRDPSLAGEYAIDLAGPSDGGCSYRVRFQRLGPELEGHALRYGARVAGDRVLVGCTASDLPRDYKPRNCN